MTFSNLLPIFFMLLIGWRLYLRYRKLVTKQRPNVKRLWLSVLLFPLLFVMIATEAFANYNAFVCLLLGGVVGIFLAHWGLRLTKFDNDETGLYYVPNSVIGLALVSIIAGRLVYKFIKIYIADEVMVTTDYTPQIMLQPITTLILGIIICYYPYYSSGILSWRKSKV